MIASHVATVLVRPTVAGLRGNELAACDTEPRHEPLDGDLGPIGPHAHEVDDLVPQIMGSPAAGQFSPGSFVATNSVVTSVIPLPFLASLATNSLVPATRSFSRLLGASDVGIRE